jgi:hypothetical protein
VDAVIMTVSRTQLAREALADVFHALKAQKAHWYQLKPPTSEEDYKVKFNDLFPYLGRLLSLTADVMHSILEAGGLIQ